MEIIKWEGNQNDRLRSYMTIHDKCGVWTYLTRKLILNPLKWLCAICSCAYCVNVNVRWL